MQQKSTKWYIVVQTGSQELYEALGLCLYALITWLELIHYYYYLLCRRKQYIQKIQLIQEWHKIQKHIKTHKTHKTHVKYYLHCQHPVKSKHALLFNSLSINTLIHLPVHWQVSWVLELSKDYAGKREQLKKPIGSVKDGLVSIF